MFKKKADYTPKHFIEKKLFKGKKICKFIFLKVKE